MKEWMTTLMFAMGAVAITASAMTQEGGMVACQR